MKRAERDIARKKEYVRRVRLQIEEKRAEVSAALMQSILNKVASISHHSILFFYLATLLATISPFCIPHQKVVCECQAAAGVTSMLSRANLEL